MKRLALVLACAALSAGFTVVRDPSALNPIVWPGATLTMVVQQDGAPDIADGSDLLAIRAAMGAWNAPACSSFNFADGGNSPTGGDGSDGQNRISFIASSWPGGASSGAVALTNRRRSGGSWTEADVILNAEFETWSTSGDVHAYDVQSVVTHELGHVLGLQHSVWPSATMYFAGRPGTTYGRTLHADDVAGLCYLYPAGPPGCSGDTDCPLFDGQLYGGASTRTNCNAGDCSAGDVGLGGACFTGGDCGSLCKTDPDEPGAGDPSVCTVACNAVAQDCAPGFRCDDASDACFPDRDDCFTHADCGGGNWKCDQDLDGKFRCMLLCVTDLHCASIVGSVCQGGISVSVPGWCRMPGVLGDGAACQSGLDCQSLSCTGGGSTPTCVGGTPDTSDGGPADDGAPPTDGGPPDPGDTGGPGDGAGGADAGADGGGGDIASDTSPATDSGDDDGPGATSTAGARCGCTEVSGPELGLILVLGVWGWRRPRRLNIS